MTARFDPDALITPARARRFASATLALSAAAIICLFLSSPDGLRDQEGRPLGSDFFSFWSAGKLVLSGDAAGAYDPTRHYTEHRALLGDKAPPFYPFLYPPAFLVVAAALATQPYIAAWLAWMGATFAAYLAATLHLLRGERRRREPGAGHAQAGEALAPPSALRAASPVCAGEDDPPGESHPPSGMQRASPLLLAAYPAALLNFLHGQNGFLIAALFAAGLAALRSRPLLAGALLGLVAIKPQYGLLIPIALAAGGHWRAFLAAALSVLLQIIAASAAFGAAIWPAFLESAARARAEVLEPGAIGWEKIQSAFAFLRALGAPVEAAYAAQGALALAAAGAVAILWRSRAGPALKGAALILGALLATPYVVDYDLVLLAPAGAFLAAEALKTGFRPGERSALAVAFLAPLAARPVGEIALIPLGWVAALALFALVVRRAAPYPALSRGSTNASKALQ
jgi:hypothetical protein